MSYDKELGKREVEIDILARVLDAFSTVAGWNLTEDSEWGSRAGIGNSPMPSSGGKARLLGWS